VGGKSIIKKRYLEMATSQAIVLAFCFIGVVSAFQNSVSFSCPALKSRLCPHNIRDSKPEKFRRFPRVLAMSNNDEGKPSGKWATPVENESLERIESVKSGVFSALSGSVAMAPFALIVQKSFFPSDAFSAQWELQHDGLAVMLALFGIVYRYAVRQVD
jgi:hypothetical protein